MKKNVVLLYLGIFLCVSFFAAVRIAHTEDTSDAYCPLATKTPYKTKNSSSVYYITDACQKVAIRNPQVYFSHFTSWNVVRLAPSVVLTSIENDPIGFLPWGARKQFGIGSLIKSPDDPKVYLLLNSALYPIVSEEAFLAYGLSWDWVEDVSKDVIQGFSQKTELSVSGNVPATLAFKYADSPDVYVLQQEADGTMTKRLVTAPEALAPYYRIDRVPTLPQTITFSDSSSGPITISERSTGEPSNSSVSAPGFVRPMGWGSSTSSQSESESDDATSTPVLLPNLALSKTVSVSTTTSSTTVQFSLYYENTGDATASGVVITETVPTGTVFSSASSTGTWSCADGAVAGTTCTSTVGSVSVNATSTRVFAVTVLESYEGTVTNTASIADDGTETDMSDNVDTASFTAIGLVNLSVSLSTPVATSSPSTTILFTMSYSNLGSGSASGVSLSTTVPSSTIFSLASSTGSWSCSDGSTPGTSCVVTIGTVAASATGSVIFAVTPYYALDGGRVTTTVSIADNGARGADTNTSNNSASLPVRVMRIPLTDLAAGLYLNQFMGGLYPNGTNTMPTAHATAGLSKAALIQQRDTSGSATSSGLIVLLSIGMTNTNVEFAQFETAFRTTLAGNRNVVVINGASGSEQYVTAWDQTSDTQYTRIQTSVLAPRGLTESQVQAVWIKLASNTPTAGLANGASADAYSLKSSLGTVVRTLKSRYPNLQQVYFSSRSYAGYTTSTVNPEPYAYESGFAVKWLIEAQINQMETGVVDSQAGNLSYATSTAPWIAWGPYIWANGTATSSEGVSWDTRDFQTGGMLVNTTGTLKVRNKLWDFFMYSPYTSWFSTSTPLALPDLINSTYLGLRGGLYPNVTNTVPSAHRLAGLEKASEIQPLDASGSVNTSSGKIVLLGIGLSNTLQAFSGFQYLLCGNTNYSARGAIYPTDENDSITPVNCVPQSNAGYNTTTLSVMNGADGGQVAYNWDGTTPATQTNLTRVSSSFFYAPFSAQQVQVIWLKLANAAPTTSLMTSSTSAEAEAKIFQRQLGRIMRVLKQTYPNLKQIFISPRTYGGYDLTNLGPEPYAYEYGFSIKWLIESQINQMETGIENPISGNLNYATGTVPWIDWGPYIWANATTSNSDGFNWRFTQDNRDESDARQDDRVHESLAGRLKVGQKLIDFFMNSEYTSWFRSQ